MTSTTSTILVLFDSTTFSTKVFTFRLEVIRMTGGTEWRILVESIIKRKTYTRAMASAAPRVPPVITRVVPLSVMAEDAWRPAVC